MQSHKLSRRRFLQNSALFTSGTLLAACAGVAAPAASEPAASGDDAMAEPTEIEFTVWGSWAGLRIPPCHVSRAMNCSQIIRSWTPSPHFDGSTITLKRSAAIRTGLRYSAIRQVA